MSDGLADGTPPLRGPNLTNWAALLADEYGHREHRPSDDLLRPYAWTNPAEFFAVATETFFCNPARSFRRQTHALPGARRLLPANPRLKLPLGAYPDGTPTRWSGPASRTQHTLDGYLEVVYARCRTNTLLATGFDLEVFYTVAKGPGRTDGQRRAGVHPHTTGRATRQGRVHR